MRFFLVFVLVGVVLIFTISSNVLFYWSRLVTADIDRDTRLIFESASAVLRDGVPSLVAWTNSQQASDVLFWTHQGQAYVYALFIWLFDLDIYTFNFLIAGQYFVSVAVTFLLLRWLRRWLGAPLYSEWFILAVVSLAPLFGEVFWGAKMFFQLPYMYSLVSLWLLLCSCANFTNAKSRIAAFFSGFFASVTALSFVSLGVPIVAGLLVAWLYETYVQWRAGMAFFWRNLVLFVMGGLLPAMLLGGYTFQALSTVELREVWVMSVHYVDVIVAAGGQHPYWLQLGYAISSFVVPEQGFSWLPVGFMSIFFLWRKRHVLSAERALFSRVLMGLAISGVVVTVLIPSHVTAQGHIWLLPLGLMSLLLVLEYWREVAFLKVLLSIFVAQALYVLWLHRYGVVFTSVCVVVGLFVGYGLFFVRGEEVQRRQWLLWRLLFAGFIVLCASSFFNDLRTFRLYVRPVLALLSEPSDQWPAYEFVRVAQGVVAGETYPGQIVLTNETLSILFPSDIYLQGLYHYRQFMSGALEQSADVVMIFGGGEGEVFDDYGSLSAGDIIYFRGFYYQMASLYRLGPGKSVWIGYPSAGDEVEEVVYPRKYVSAEEVQRYLEWRRAWDLSNTF